MQKLAGWPRHRVRCRCERSSGETADGRTASTSASRARMRRRLRQEYDELIQEIEEKKRLHAALCSQLRSKDASAYLNDEPLPLHSAGDATGARRDSATSKDLLNIVMVAAECAPYSKTGGLADVVGALPKSLGALGHRIMVVVPRYAPYASADFSGVRMQYGVFGASQEVGYYHEFRDGVDFVFVDHPSYHNRGNDLYSGSWLDVAFRCALLCKAALEAPWHVPCGDVPYGDASLVYVANDWHSALLPVYLRAHYQDHGKLEYARSLFVIHNISFQGRGPLEELSHFEIPEQYAPSFRLYDPIGGEHMNILKAALIHADRLVAVSRGYAWECQSEDGGWGLDGVMREQSWKLRGIVNGIDTNVWSPATDPHLRTDGYANYSRTSRHVKAACKAALQRELGLPIDPDVPLLGFVGRLDYQKGVDLIRDSFDWLMGEGVQLVLLGAGRPDLEESLREMERRRSQQCRAWVGFSNPLAHRITAGCDLLLMPSRFEPCGLNQLYAFAYGTVPIVHAVGGLRDTVVPFDPFENTGTGWTFDLAEAESLRTAIHHAVRTYREFPEAFAVLQDRGMSQDFGWPKAAAQYIEVLQEAKFQW